MVERRRWISPKECAEYLSLNQFTVYALIARGEIPASRIGRSVRVDLKRLEEIMVKKETAQTSSVEEK